MALDTCIILDSACDLGYYGCPIQLIHGRKLLFLSAPSRTFLRKMREYKGMDLE